MPNGGSRSQESITNVAVAIDRDKNSQFAVKWAIDNLNLSGFVTLLHVKIQQNLSPQEYVPKEGRAPTLEELKQLFLTYRGFCARKGVRANEVVLDNNDVGSAIAEYVVDNSIGTIVLGASSRNALSRAFKFPDIQGNLIRCVPDFCSVHAVSKAKTQLLKTAKRSSPNPTSFTSSRQQQHSRPAATLPESPLSEQFYRGNRDVYSGSQGSWKSAVSDISDSDGGGSQAIIYSDKSNDLITPTSRNGHGGKNHSPANNGGEVVRVAPRNASPLHPLFSGTSSSDELGHSIPRNKQSSSRNLAASPMHPAVSGTPTNRTPAASRIPPSTSPVNNPNFRLQTQGGSPYNSLSGSSDLSEPMSFQSSGTSFEQADQSNTSDGGSRSSFNLQTAVEVEDEIRRLRQELKHTMEMYNSACREAIAAKEKAKEIDQWKSNEARKSEECKRVQEVALIMMEMEKNKCKAAIEAAQMAQRLAELECQKRKQAEMQLLQEAEEKKKAMDALARNDVRYRRYTIEEIEEATNHFSNKEKIGEGGYGPVYKAHLDHTAVAIKVLRPDISQGKIQFQREIEVLSRMRHPNMVLLLGACPEYGCLVYEFMDNGSLEDRLFCRNGSSPLPWRVRFRIAAEIATALLFLHQTRPEPLVHRDLKPANILLDKNFVSKIGDVGLSRLVPSSVADSVTQYHMTAAAGTFCYIDPEYQQSGMLGTKSDIYSFGVVLLQIITAKPAMGLMYQVEEAIEQGTFAKTLDPKVTDWPVDEALPLAKLALKCCELRRKDRPDLGTVILPELERLRDLGSNAEG